jgi:hypothetical protein
MRDAPSWHCAGRHRRGRRHEVSTISDDAVRRRHTACRAIRIRRRARPFARIFHEAQQARRPRRQAQAAAAARGAKHEAGVDEALVDEAVAETMPASDPISPYSHETSKPVDLKKDERPAGGKDTEPPAKWQGWKRGE